MKKASVSVILGMVWDPKRIILCLATLLCALVFCLGGCRSTEQLGETEAEGHRRHLRNLRINQQQMIEDIDTAMLLDEPSRATKKNIP